MNRTELLKRITNKPQVVPVEGFGDFKIKGMSSSDYLFAGAKSVTGEGEDEVIDQDAYFAALVCRCTLDPKGKRLFNDEDFDQLLPGDPKFILPLALAIQKMSGVLSTKDEVKKG